MAASSTDAYNNDTSPIGSTLPLFSNYPVFSVSTGHNNLWPGEAPASNSTSPSSEHNWEVDEEEAVKRKIYELKRQFHNGRYLIVRHLPRDASEEDVRSLLTGYLVHSVQIQPSNGTARVLLAEPEVLETWGKAKNHTLRGQKVTISPSNTEGLVCVARLPHEYSEEDFGSLVSSFGETTYYFLMRSEKTGESKGYGFVEYTSKEMALHAKSALDGMEIQDTTLVCEWLDPNHVTFASLHSTCLYVDCLPKDYRDLGEFRRIFSKVTNPPYCQIAMKQGALQDWGLVEFNTSEDAELTLNLLNGHKIKENSIRVLYYIPGVRAINIYMKLLNDSGPKNCALLPEPPTNKVCSQLKNLAKHNPAFAKSLQNIILTQIQSLQQKGLSQGRSTEMHLGPMIKGGRDLGPPQNTTPLPFPLQQQFPLQPHLPQPLQLHPSPFEQPLNINAQAALVILLAAQLQQQKEQQQQQQQQQQQHIPGNNNNNILSNPQVLNLLQSLVYQGDPQHPIQPVFSPASTSSHSNNVISSNLKNNFRNRFIKNGASKLPKGPLLPTPMFSVNSREDPGADSEGADVPMVADLITGIKDKEDLSSSVASLLSNTHNLQQLLGSLSPESPPLMTQVGSLPCMPTQHTFSTNIHPSLIASPPLFHPPLPSTDPMMNLLLRAADAGRPDQYFSPVEVPPHSAPFLLSPHRVPPPVVTTWSGPPPSPASQALFQTPTGLFPQPSPAFPQRLFSPIYLTAARPIGSPQPQLIAPHQFPFSVGGFASPVGQKRKTGHFPSLTESSSPETEYVGQHLQGIGGHYPDSYSKKKKVIN